MLTANICFTEYLRYTELVDSKIYLCFQARISRTVIFRLYISFFLFAFTVNKKFLWDIMDQEKAKGRFFNILYITFRNLFIAKNAPGL